MTRTSLANAVVGASIALMVGSGTARAAENTPAVNTSAQPTIVAPRGDAAKGQVIAGQVCAACHGADGNSALAANPVLAGQHAGYIAKQLAEFKAGVRKNAIMMGFAAALSQQDMLDLGAFYSRQKATPRAANDKELALIGQKLFRAGNTAVGLPACAGCHSPNGAGIPAQYPRLAGQHTEYTIGQLRAFYAGERGNDSNKVMRTIASRLSEREMQAVAEYVSGLTSAR
ncbi:MAG: cytochrome c4 [Proteobacteria bacterium]|nr:cytochrome c4 [Burkholderiales bacterium]